MGILRVELLQGLLDRLEVESGVVVAKEQPPEAVVRAVGEQGGAHELVVRVGAVAGALVGAHGGGRAELHGSDRVDLEWGGLGVAILVGAVHVDLGLLVAREQQRGPLGLRAPALLLEQVDAAGVAVQHHEHGAAPLAVARVPALELQAAALGGQAREEQPAGEHREGAGGRCADGAQARRMDENRLA